MCAITRKTLLLGLPILLLLLTEANGMRYELNEDNWKHMLKGEWMVQFVAPWCPSCKVVAPIWERFERISGKFNVKVATIDITKSPALSGRFFVTSLPSIYHVIDGKFRFYRGQRDIDALTTFVKLKQWKDVAPLSRWNDPNAYHMGILSYFFRISLMLKEWNARLQYDYGFSVYTTNGIFAMVTIMIAAIFGLLLITLLDFVCPTKKRRATGDGKKTIMDENEDKDNKLAKDDNDDDDLAEEKDDADSIESILKDNDENYVDANMTYDLPTDKEFISSEDELEDEEIEIDDCEDIFDENLIHEDLVNSARKRYTL